MVSADEVAVEDFGPFPSIGETATSRCPDQGTDVAQLYLLSADKELAVSVTHPDDDDALVHFSVPVNKLRFDRYLNQGAVWSNARYYLNEQVISNDLKWVADVNAAVSMACRNGYYGPFDLGGVIKIKYVSSGLKLYYLGPISRLNLEEDEDLGPPPDECDDPFTDLVEESPCDNPYNPPGPVGVGGSQTTQISVETAPPGGSGGTGPMRYMCNVTYWYESYSGGPRVLVAIEVDYNSCAWESY